LQSEAQIYCDPGNFTFSAKLLNERPIGSYEKGDKAKNEILLLMAGKEMLSEYSQVLREAGIHNVNYSVDILASIKSAELWLMKHAESCDKTAIIHIGAQTTNISIIRAGILIFTRSMLNKENKISAEKICFEAKRTFEYFLENSREDKISRILLSGGRVDEQFRKKICKGLQIETEVANSLEEIEVNTENKLEIVNNLNSYPVAIGLALISIHANHVSKLSSGFF
jgi:Tfp pilus assembly PilM family ATPase